MDALFAFEREREIGYIGVMEKKMEATILGYMGQYRVYRGNGKANGSYHIGIYRAI